MKLTKITVSTLAILAASTTVSMARDNLLIVGSSTVFPYTQAVAEQFANQGGAAPVVESTGTGGGFKVFCGGVGVEHADITGASRAIKKSEYDLCVQNGVTDITEALIGYDGLAMAVSRTNEFAWDLTLEQVYLALAAKVPVDGALIDNPYKTWADIDATLPATEIIVWGPPPTSGTRDAFVELAMHAGCAETEFAKALEADEAAYEKFIDEDCSRMRQDGNFVEAGENDNLIVQRLEADPNTIGIFGYSFLFENLDKLKGVNIGGVEPDLETIASFDYPIARPLFFYVKNAHRGVILGMQEFLDTYAAEEALSADGYLAERGLVALAPEKIVALQDALKSGASMAAPE